MTALRLSLDEPRCTACGACVTVCPTQCLGRTPHGPWLARPVDCVHCGACVAVCVPQALALAAWGKMDTGGPRDD